MSNSLTMPSVPQVNVENEYCSAQVSRLSNKVVDIFTEGSQSMYAPSASLGGAQGSAFSIGSRCVKSLLPLGLAMLLALFACPGGAAAGGGGVGLTRQQIDNLRSVAARIQSNHEKIHSWKGRARIKRTVYGMDRGRPDDRWDRKEFEQEIRFWQSDEHQAFRWEITYLHNKEMDRNGDLIKDRPVARESGMIKNDLFYVTNRMTKESRDMQKHTLLIRDKEASGGGDATRGTNPSFFNPKDSLRLFSETFYEMTAGSVLQLEQVPVPEGVKLTLEEEDNLLTYTIDAGPHGYTIYSYDKDRGYSFVSMESDDKVGLRQSEKVIYDLIDGIYVPVKRVSTTDNYDPKTGKDSWGQRRELSFEESLLNVPMSESEFSIAAMEMLRPGDKIEDTRTGLEYVYNPDSAIRDIDKALVREEVASTVETQTRTGTPAGGDPREQNPKRPLEEATGKPVDFSYLLVALLLATALATALVLVWHKKR